MKVDTDRLKAIYRDYIRQKTPASLDGCPSPERLLRLLRSRSSDGEATEIIDHVSRCRFCFSEFGFVLDILRQERDFVREIEKRRSIDGKPGRWKGLRQKLFGLLWGRRASFPQFSWQAALVLAGFILASFMVARFAIFRPSETYRSGSQSRIELIEPAGDEISGQALVFRWKKSDHSEYYVLELFDQTLAPVWTSGKTTEEYVAPPKELTATLEVNQPYFWEVTAYQKNGEKNSSPIGKFVLTE